MEEKREFLSIALRVELWKCLGGNLAAPSPAIASREELKALSGVARKETVLAQAGLPCEIVAATARLVAFQSLVQRLD